MPVTDPVADMLTVIRNANMRGYKKAVVQHSKFKEEILKVLSEERYITTYKVMPDEIFGDKKKTLHIYLRYGPDNEKIINKIILVTKPGRRIYRSISKLKRVLDGLGMAILSTSKGVITDKQARKLNIGGEVICKVW